MSDVEVTDHPDRSEWQARVDGGLALAGVAVYELAPGQITFLHTEVEPDFEGRGVGGSLARVSLDAARAAGEAVVPQCPFYIGWMRRHPEYLDIVAPAYRFVVAP